MPDTPDTWMLRPITTADDTARWLVALTEGEALQFTGLPFFAPELKTIWLPAWDCLPYDWASPSPVAMGRRMAALRAAKLVPSTAKKAKIVKKGDVTKAFVLKGLMATAGAKAAIEAAGGKFEE